MAVPLSSKEWEDFDQTRIRLAVEELLASVNGQFFLSNLLAAFGHNHTPFDPDPILSAYRAGRHSCAKDLEATLRSADPYALVRLEQAAVEENLIRAQLKDTLQ